MRRFEWVSGLGKLDTYCWTEGAFLRKTFRLLSEPASFTPEEPCGTGKRDLLEDAVTSGGGDGLKDGKLPRRAI